MARSRETNITGNGKPVQRRGNGLGTGPVGQMLYTEALRDKKRSGSNGKKKRR